MAYRRCNRKRKQEPESFHWALAARHLPVTRRWSPGAGARPQRPPGHGLVSPSPSPSPRRRPQWPHKRPSPARPTAAHLRPGLLRKARRRGKRLPTGDSAPIAGNNPASTSRRAEPTADPRQRRTRIFYVLATTKTGDGGEAASARRGSRHPRGVPAATVLPVAKMERALPSADCAARPRRSARPEPGTGLLRRGEAQRANGVVSTARLRRWRPSTCAPSSGRLVRGYAERDVEYGLGPVLLA